MPEPSRGLKVLLCGYHEVGARVLRHLAARQDVGDVFLFTHSPGRAVPDVRDVARDLGVPFTLRSVNKGELPFTPDIVSVVYYRYIVRPHVIAACDGRIYNLHPSLLPRHRGCSSVPWAMIAGDAQTGITYHYIDPSVDTGRILVQATVPIGPETTQGELYRAAMDRGAEYWPAAFELVKAGFPGGAQVGASCYHPRGVPHGAEIQDGWSEARVARFLRAMAFPPLPGATYRGEPVTTLDQWRRLGGRPGALDRGCEGCEGEPSP